MSLSGHFASFRRAAEFCRYRGHSGHGRTCCWLDPVVNDPNVWSGRALQEVFVDLVVSGLASMYPVSSWSCLAPDHHGYQRACVLISGQASIGPFGSPVFACAGKTDPLSLISLADLGWKLLIGLCHRLLLISPSSFVRA
jgi:hypothetical protein